MQIISVRDNDNNKQKRKAIKQNKQRQKRTEKGDRNYSEKSES